MSMERVREIDSPPMSWRCLLKFLVLVVPMQGCIAWPEQCALSLECAELQWVAPVAEAVHVQSGVDLQLRLMPESLPIGDVELLVDGESIGPLERSLSF